MTANQSRLLSAALLLAAGALAMQFTRGGDPPEVAPAKGPPGDPSDRNTRFEQSQARAKERLERGAYVLRSKQISGVEIIQTIIIPEGLSDEFDTRCVVYQNAEIRTSSITCTGILFRPPLPPA